MVQNSRNSRPGDRQSNRLLLLALVLVAAAVAWTIISNWVPPARETIPVTLRPPDDEDLIRDLRVLAVMVSDDSSPNPLPTPSLERRLRIFAELLSQASFGRMTARFEVRTLSARDLGAPNLAGIARGFFEWRKRAIALVSDEDFDVLIVVPSDSRKEGFCNDNSTLGSPLGQRITLCLERYHDVSNAQEDEAAAALLIHKLMHGYGFNHQIPEHKPLVFLEWALGLPRESASPFAGFEDRPPLFFDPYVTSALGLIPHNPLEADCLISQGLACVPWRAFCANLYNLSCLDSDRDGVRDSLDLYPLSPPRTAGQPDADNDGIPDGLDLCPGPVIEVKAKGLLGPAKVAFGDEAPTASFSSREVSLRSLFFTCADLSDGFTRFPAAQRQRASRRSVALPRNCLIARVELRYFTDQEYLRPVYLYTGQQQWETVWDKEWFYFSRFGCDVPTKVDWTDHATFDANLDGLPDADLFGFARRMPLSYDWDADDVPDRLDTLPTVSGTCGNDTVKGSPDHDGDGWCDPSRLELLPYQPGAWPQDLAARLAQDPQADACPYLAATGNQGCP